MKWSIEIIPRNAEGEELYLRSLKPFRLASLQLEPKAFSSTFERESAFGDSEWLARLHNPAVTAFIARRDDTDAAESAQLKVLSSLILLRVVQGEGDVDNIALWEVNAVFTLPDARRKGIATELLKEAMCWARKSAEAEGRLCVLAVRVYMANTTAAALYRAVGFVDVDMVDGEETLRLEWKGGLG
ncbi:hypothetical protein MCOR25_003638 [Pyricularia grisea]|uniref:N-acetyltransferase domain-containing protein n=1 Tax=Pyricularia grisea TaxID=148305 RepID=A0A6P8B2E3_PYRGI|nr:uncharacterized protein PgNI_07491 [Pyricularia grisea]KAI6372672.1 hypothetical protein MCOR25_003638 [Pyricularia grisea]TLD08969.1 hypothetical protein PgNI_07491 [Pyricularia grisea]